MAARSIFYREYFGSHRHIRLFPLPRQLQLLGLFFLLLFKDNRVDSIGVSGIFGGL